MKQVFSSIHSPVEKRLYNIGLIVYVFLLILSVVYYQERVILYDNSFYLFEMIRTESFCIQRFRVISFLPELLAFLAIKIGAPLIVVSVLFSVGYSLFYFVIYLIVGLFLRKYQLAIVLLLVNTLIVSHTFFWNISELYLGIGLLILFFAIATEKKFKTLNVWQNNTLLFLLILISSSHPLILFPFAFMLYYLFRQKALEGKMTLYISSVFLIFYIVNRVYFTDWYDSEKLNAVNNIKTLFPHYLNIETNHLLLKDAIRPYLFALILWVISLAFYLQKRKCFDLIITNLFLFGYLFLVNVSFPNGVKSFYMENMYLVVSMVLGLIFIFEIVPTFKRKAIAPAFILIISIACIGRIVYYKQEYTDRINWYKTYFEGQENKNIALPTDVAPNEILTMSWAIPFEVNILSTIEYGETYGLVFLDELNERNEEKPFFQNQFITPWSKIPYNELPQQYFKFSNEPYLVKYELK
ncbi:MAG TPA: hypothetical protein VLZ75_09130 [Chitinophagales bacterium]|nr:hypothetical protein [Chitinophagales bacterium]